MDMLVIAVLAAIGIIAVTALAPKVGTSAPLILVVLGVGLSLLPNVNVEIEPEWILAGVLPPLLYATSVSMPTMDFRRDFAAISGMSVVLVVISAVVLGLGFTLLIPGIPLSVGIALGAIISPTDAVATSIVRRLGVSPRLVTILEGESLLNDASALVLLRSAIAATAGTVSLWGVVGDFAFAVVVAVGIGVAVGMLSLVVRKRTTDTSITTAISFVVPFVAYFPAEHLGASGLVATVSAGLVAGTGSARFLHPEVRLAEAANWRTLEMLIEGAVFLLMGLELSGFITESQDSERGVVVAVALAAVAAVAVLLLRAAYLAPLLWRLARRRQRMDGSRQLLTDIQEKIDNGTLGDGELRDRIPVAGGKAARIRRGGPGRRLPARPEEGTEPEPVVLGGAGPTGDVVAADAAAVSPARSADRARSFSHRITRRLADMDYLAAERLGRKEGAVLVWAGMRGAVTVAAAQTLPAATPQRATLVLVAFFVALGTLLVQGGTLPWLVRRLDLARPQAVDPEERARLQGMLREAVAGMLLDPGLSRPDGSPYDDEILDRARQLVTREEEEIDELEDPEGVRARQAAQAMELRLRLIDAQRGALLEARRLGTFSSAALKSALTVLDADQISAELRERGEDED